MQCVSPGANSEEAKQPAEDVPITVNTADVNFHWWIIMDNYSWWRTQENNFLIDQKQLC